jgi:tetratricopeptide (TPR) repeat protein
MDIATIGNGELDLYAIAPEEQNVRQRSLEEVIERNPTSFRELSELAQLHAVRREYDDARYFHLLAARNEKGGVTCRLAASSFFKRNNWLDESIEVLAVNEENDGVLEVCRLNLARARLLRSKKLFTEALSALESAALVPEYLVEAECERVITLSECRRSAEALELIGRLVESYQHGSHQRLALEMSRAASLTYVGREPEALQIFRDEMERWPSNFGIRANAALLHLSQGLYAEGWHLHQYRNYSPMIARRLFPFAPWDGTALHEGKLLVAAEQGLGDEIMFSSCMPDLLEVCGRVVLECSGRLSELFARSFPTVEILDSNDQSSINQSLIGRDDITHVTLVGDLPRLFRNDLASFKRTKPYLVADSAKRHKWRNVLDGLPGKHKVGLSWKGGTVTTRTHARSLDIDEFKPLIEASSASFISLQYHSDAPNDVATLNNALRSERIFHYKPAISDYDETAALVSELDLVVSVCTSVIHLAGALGKQTFVLVPSVPEWRYGANGTQMHWYPSVKLFRQADDSSWSEVIRAIIVAMDAYLAMCKLGTD